MRPSLLCSVMASAASAGPAPTGRLPTTRNTQRSSAMPWPARPPAMDVQVRRPDRLPVDLSTSRPASEVSFMIGVVLGSLAGRRLVVDVIAVALCVLPVIGPSPWPVAGDGPASPRGCAYESARRRTVRPPLGCGLVVSCTACRQPARGRFIGPVTPATASPMQRKVRSGHGVVAAACITLRCMTSLAYGVASCTMKLPV